MKRANKRADFATDKESYIIELFKLPNDIYNLSFAGKLADKLAHDSKSKSNIQSK